MSQYQIRTREHTIVLGWDWPLQTYFATVWIEDWDSLKNFNPVSCEPEPLLRLGCKSGEVATVDELAGHLRPYLEFTAGMRSRLENDRVPCCCCGQEPGEPEWVVEGQGRLPVCYRCHFWLGKRDAGGLVIEGSHYQLGPEGKAFPFRGYYRRRFVIETNDGRRIETTNLWCQGEIPEHLREMFPDNARFVEVDTTGFGDRFDRKDV
jgi:hypothetical protein